jgi:hypothetical protein
MFSYLTALVPHDKDKPLIGTPDVVLDFGLGVIKGFEWGTITLRVELEYDTGSESESDWGETAIEYLKRLSPRFDLFAALEVDQGDEASFIAGLQYRIDDDIVIMANSGVGLTSKASDWSPELGVVFKFP